MENQITPDEIFEDIQEYYIFYTQISNKEFLDAHL